MKHKTRWTKKKLLALGVPAVLIPGIIIAHVLGWDGAVLNQTKNYYANKTVFPDSGKVGEIVDGDTFKLKSGTSVRLIGINAPNRGSQNYDQSRQELTKLVANKEVYLEYDRYQDDQYGRILAWVWAECEAKPEFLPPDYMSLTRYFSKPGLKENPAGCKNGKLVNEVMVKNGLAVVETFKDRGELKYEVRISQ